MPVRIQRKRTKGWRMSRHLTPEMKRVLRRLRRGAPQDARSLQCSIRTLMALERRKLITVETTFTSIAFPRTALAWLRSPDAGGRR